MGPPASFATSYMVGRENKRKNNRYNALNPKKQCSCRLSGSSENRLFERCRPIAENRWSGARYWRYMNTISQQSSPLMLSPWYKVVRCVSREDKPYKEHSLTRTGLRAWGVSSLKITSLNVFNTVHWKQKKGYSKEPWLLLRYLTL